MIVFQMRMLTKDGQVLDTDNYDTLALWCKVETEEEWLVYERFGEGTGEKHLWNDMVKHAGIPYLVNLGDEDIYAYLSPDEAMPDLNERYRDADDNVWERI